MKKLQTGLSRRHVLMGAGAVASPLLLPSLSSALAAIPTPRQTEGPFYPWRTPKEQDNNLRLVRGAGKGALGQGLELAGVVRSRKGVPMSGLLVEIWQCDFYGAYHDVSDMPRMDSGFQGYGKMVTDGEGHYHFNTIKPTIYPGRTPHIHFKLTSPGGQELITQMYSRDEQTNNAKDGIYSSLSKDERRAVTITFTETGATMNNMPVLQGIFDIVLPA